MEKLTWVNVVFVVQPFLWACVIFWLSRYLLKDVFTISKKAGIKFSIAMAIGAFLCLLMSPILKPTNTKLPDGKYTKQLLRESQDVGELTLDVPEKKTEVKTKADTPFEPKL